MAAGRMARRRGRRRPRRASAAHPVRARRAGRHDSRPLLPVASRSGPRAEIRRDYAALAAVARAPRRRRDRRVAVHAAAGDRAARRGRRSRLRVLAGRAGLGAPRAGARTCPPTATSCSSARSSRARTSASCSTPTSGWRRAARRVPPLRIAGGAGPAPARVARSHRAGRRSTALVQPRRLRGRRRPRSALSPARARSCCRRSTRASACPRSKRCRRAFRWSRRTAARCPEVVGDAGVALRPRRRRRARRTPSSGSPPTTAWALERAAAGLARARAFTWDAAARALRRAYDDAVARDAVQRRAPPPARAVS